MPRTTIVALLATLSTPATALKEQCDQAGYPRIVIGCWQLLERHDDREQAVKTLKAYADAGFTSFDTADIYGPSESLLGTFAMQTSAKPKFFTKYVTQDATVTEARRVNAVSRQALGAVPDLVQLHWWDYLDSRFVDAAKHLVTLKGEGLLHEVAACNFDTPHLRELMDAGVPIVANQVQYSLLDRRPENAMLSYAKEKGIRLSTFGTVAGGWLSDKFLGKPPPKGRNAARTVSMRMYKSHLDRWSRGDWELFQELLRTMRTVADKHATTIANVAVAWVLYQLGDDGGWVILGVRDTTHLDEHKGLRDVALDADDVAQIGAVLAKGASPAANGDIWSFERGLA
tara:strand:- start:1429 stop:2457 length:1029 start_codon:yes stop_codon:yes gene_type:complete